MQYILPNNKTIIIPDSVIKNSMDKLDLTKDEAVQMWLEDNDYAENAEQNELDSKAQKIKIDHGASAEKPRKKSEKPRTIKVSDVKKALFIALNGFLDEFAQTNDAKISVLTENKLISVEFGGETFKIDLIQQRKPKNK